MALAETWRWVGWEGGALGSPRRGCRARVSAQGASQRARDGMRMSVFKKNAVVNLLMRSLKINHVYPSLKKKMRVHN